MGVCVFLSCVFELPGAEAETETEALTMTSRGKSGWKIGAENRGVASVAALLFVPSNRISFVAAAHRLTGSNFITSSLSASSGLPSVQPCRCSQLPAVLLLLLLRPSNRQNVCGIAAKCSIYV